MSKRVAAHTLGCKVNQYDTQAMLERFQQSGYEVVDFHSQADVYLVNTCTVTQMADKKSRQFIRQARNHDDAIVVACGCFSQREHNKAMELGADVVIGNADREHVVEYVERAMAGNCCDAVHSLKGESFEPLFSLKQTEHTRSHMKIQEGCNNFCTYCIIPYVRGRSRSRRIEDIRREAEVLHQSGCQEVVLTGINLSAYGHDLEGDLTLLDAIRAVVDSGMPRVRLGSLDSGIFDEAMLRYMAEHEQVCRHLHLSLQSGCDNTLKAMGRNYSADDYRKEVALIREVMPDAAITTDVMTGFPGESEEDYQASLAFVEAIAFSRIHVFPYSIRPGTRAAKMGDQVPKTVKQKRAAEMSALGEELELSYVRSLVGKRYHVLVEEMVDDYTVEGYSGEYVRVQFAGDESAINTICEVTITGTDGVVALAETAE